MSRSELITTPHLARNALISIRPSTPPPVLTHQESLQRPYALRQRALQLGWRADDLDVIEADWGLTAVTAAHRAGFKDLVPQVTLSQVGSMLSLEVTRLARHLTDGDPLLDICGDKGCLIADRDGVDDPATPHGRRVLGVKGTVSAMERQTIRARLTAGLLPQAARGDLALALPLGLRRDPFGQGQQTPDLAVQHCIALIFATVLRVHTASKGFQFFKAQRRRIPGRDRCGDLEWKTPPVSAILAVRKPPADAGAFVDGRSQTMRHASAPFQATQTPLPLDAWQIRVHDTDPASMSWETYVQIRAMRTDHDVEDDRTTTRGSPRAGAALLHGRLYGGACGPKMMVHSTGGTLSLGNALRQKDGGPVCQHMPADGMDAAVVDACFPALSPLARDL
jgi:DNA invertase Pin-like site-specific DNA recombinase